MERFFVPLVLLLSLPSFSVQVKFSVIQECIQPSKEPRCDFPYVPKDIGEKCTSEAQDSVVDVGGETTLNTKKACQVSIKGSRSVCELFALGIFDQLQMFEVVMFHVGLCNDFIPIGLFTQEDSDKSLREDQELVFLEVNGSDLLSALNHGMNISHTEKLPDAFPATAGIRYRQDDSKTYIYDVEFLQLDCTWESLDLFKTYRILSDETLANGGFGYFPLTNAKTSATHWPISEVFFSYAQKVCALRTIPNSFRFRA